MTQVLPNLVFVLGTPKPEFVGEVENVTVPVGRDAIFTCNVKNLGRFRVSYFLSTLCNCSDYKYFYQESNLNNFI